MVIKIIEAVAMIYFALCTLLLGAKNDFGNEIIYAMAAVLMGILLAR